MAKFNLRRFIKTAALITLLLAVIEVVVIFVVKEKKEKLAIGHKKAPAKNAKVDSLIDTIRQQPSGYHEPSLTTEHSIDSSSKYAQPIYLQPAYHSAGDSVKQVKTIVGSIPDTLQKIKAKKPGKRLTRDEMNNILNDVEIERKRLNISAKCVQLQKTTNSNVENAFAVAAYLRRYGYIISGRLTVPKSQSGITIEADGNCIVVAVGRKM